MFVLVPTPKANSKEWDSVKKRQIPAPPVPLAAAPSKKPYGKASTGPLPIALGYFTFAVVGLYRCVKYTIR